MHKRLTVDLDPGDDLCHDLFISERHEGGEIDEAPGGKGIHRTGVREPGASQIQT